MRPILALAILLLGLKAAFPEIKFSAMAELKFQGAKFGTKFGTKFQDRVPADENVPSSDVETADASGEFAIGAPEIGASDDLGTPDTVLLQSGATGIKKSDRVRALLSPLAIEGPDAGHDQSEATGEPQAPAPLTTGAEAAPNDSDSIGGLCHALLTSAQDNDLPVPFFANLIWQESRLQRDSVSRAGALGIAQFMPDVATEVGLADPFDPQQAIPASARFLKVLRQQFGNLGYVAAAYNAGAHRVGEWLDRRRKLPQETRTYVLRVTGRSAEAWRKSPPDDSKLAFERGLPCRALPAFAELQQAQLRDTPQRDDVKDPRPQQEKIAARVAHLIVRKVAARIAARAASRITAKAAAKAAHPSGGGSVAYPIVGENKAAKPAGAAATNIMAHNFHARHDALRRPQPVPREKRRLA